MSSKRKNHRRRNKERRRRRNIEKRYWQDKFFELYRLAKKVDMTLITENCFKPDNWLLYKLGTNELIISGTAAEIEPIIDRYWKMKAFL
jgi:hypothetical protein